MKYISTRGKAPVLSFEDVILTGLAEDGGLYVPENLPHFSTDDIASWAGLTYQQLAFKIMSPFIGDEIPKPDIEELIEKSYSTFRHDAIAPLVQLGNNMWVLELFHGPTLAFKDFALQFLGNLLDYILKKRNQRVVVLGATSGDTGSAAIEGCKHCDNLDIFILHPHNRVSDVQRRQMTTVLDKNVHNIAVEGNFDDCQNIVKASFGSQKFLPDGRQLVAVNSINWARIMAQIVYYFYSALALGAPHRQVSFSVPTGNFGDIFAGFLASKMGLPVAQLVVATNANDILHRCISNNDHSLHQLVHSLSPSMDIMVSSNFERLLFDLYHQDGAAIASLMSTFKSSGAFKLDEKVLAEARRLFDSSKLDDNDTLDTIARVYQRCDYLLDPHSAIGLAAGQSKQRDTRIPMICLATAHPAKFPEAVTKAGYPNDPPLPVHMADLFDREERFTVLPGDDKKIQGFIADNLQA